MREIRAYKTPCKHHLLISLGMNLSGIDRKDRGTGKPPILILSMNFSSRRGVGGEGFLQRCSLRRPSEAFRIVVEKPLEQVVQQVVAARGPRAWSSPGGGGASGAAGEVEDAVEADRVCLAALSNAVFKNKILFTVKKDRYACGGPRRRIRLGRCVG